MGCKLHILSDLHIESGDLAAPSVGDVVVLAGDIGRGVGGVRWARDTFTDRPVCYVLGNHEWYRGLFPDLLDDIRAAAARSNVHVLECDEFVFERVRLLGCTLWTDFTLQGHGRQEAFAAAAKHGMNDFLSIRKPSGELLHVSDVVKAHRESVKWLEASLATPFAGQTVVITHHAPSLRSVHPALHLDPLTPAFANNMDNLITNYSPALWIHGHTHVSVDYRIGNTRVVSNPRGYGFEAEGGATEFDPGFVIEL